jgi:hypothetical protein
MLNNLLKTAKGLVYVVLVTFYGVFIVVGLMYLWRGLSGPG